MIRVSLLGWLKIPSPVRDSYTKQPWDSGMVEELHGCKRIWSTRPWSEEDFAAYYTNLLRLTTQCEPVPQSTSMPLFFGWSCDVLDAEKQVFSCAQVEVACVAWERLMCAFSETARCLKELDSRSLCIFSEPSTLSVADGRCNEEEKLQRALAGIEECKSIIHAWTNLPASLCREVPLLSSATHDCLQVYASSIAHWRVLAPSIESPETSRQDALSYLRAVYELTNCDFNRALLDTKEAHPPLHCAMRALNQFFGYQLANVAAR